MEVCLICKPFAHKRTERISRTNQFIEYIQSWEEGKRMQLLYSRHTGLVDQLLK